MGAALAAMVAEAEKVAGLKGKLMLAGITRVTTAQAASIVDTPQLIAQFRDGLAQVKAALAPGAPPELARSAGGTSTDTLRKHLDGFLDLMTQRSLVLGDSTETARRVDELAANTLDCARVSVWLLSPNEDRISCLDLYERTHGKHSAGTELFAKDFGAYFVALTTQRTIAAHEAQLDARTNCFTEVYLKPLGITSMLDVPIWVNSKMVGVVCHEHIGKPRVWNADEERFAYLMAAFVSLAMERVKS